MKNLITVIAGTLCFLIVSQGCGKKDDPSNSAGREVRSGMYVSFLSDGPESQVFSSRSTMVETPDLSSSVQKRSAADDRYSVQLLNFDESDEVNPQRISLSFYKQPSTTSTFP